jgi:hypothetical protein
VYFFTLAKARGTYKTLVALCALFRSLIRRPEQSKKYMLYAFKFLIEAPTETKAKQIAVRLYENTMALKDYKFMGDEESI